MAMWRIGPVVDGRVTRGTLCVVTPGENVAPDVSAGPVVRFVRAPVPGTAVAVFEYAPGDTVSSRNEGLWFGNFTALYYCRIDRTRLRLLERWEES